MPSRASADKDALVRLARQVHVGPSHWDGIPHACPAPIPPGMFAVGPELRDLLEAAPPEFQKALQRMPAAFKPDGGFWTATAEAGGGSAWERFARNTGLGPRHPERFLYDVIGEPVVMVLADDSDVLAAIDAAGKGKVRLAEANAFWRLAPTRWDAVHVPATHEHHGCLNTWDVESTIWFRPERHLRLVGRMAMPDRGKPRASPKRAP